MEVINNKRRGVVAAGSVWESRMKSDEVKGGIKVFKAEQNPEKEQQQLNVVSRLKKSPIGSSSSKRKTWSSQNPIQISREKSDTHKNSEEQCISSCDGINKSPIQTKNKFERSPIQSRKLRSDTQKSGEAGQLRKIKSDPIKKIATGTCTHSIQLRKSKSELDRNPENEQVNEVDELEGECEKNQNIEAEENDENCDVCQEKEISSTVGVVQNSHQLLVQVGIDDSDDVIDDSDEEVVVDEEIEIENESFDVKEISIPESKVEEKQEIDKVVVVSEQEKNVFMNEAEPKKVVNAHMRFHHKNERRPVSVPLVVKQSPTIRRNSIPKKEEHSSFPQTQSKLQSLVDLIMWTDVSKSAFVFGVGTFIIISSSYANDINLSVISAMSYVGLVYLAVIFLYRSLICRGVIDVEDSNYVVREADAIWMLKCVLPYLNEFLSKLKALFSGDPGTTMKLAVLLFVLARCGSFITIWKMAKFGFFGVFIVPKICSSYSAQLTAYANFWIRRFRDAWDSCTHKKAVALGIFGLVWNLSSVVARIWAVFVLFVAFRYYQQHYTVREEWVEDETECDETSEEPVRQKQTSFVPTNKVKKGF